MKKGEKVLLEQKAKTQFVAGIINENAYESLIQQIALDFQKNMEYEEERDEMYLLESNRRILGFDKKDSKEIIFINESDDKNLDIEVDIEKGSIYDILGMDLDEKISSKYTSGAKLAKALMDKVGNQKEVVGMLSVAASENVEEEVFDRALRYMKHIDESVTIEINEDDFS